jgi:glycosyltransferase involved in cell wall biosynthesis
LNSVRTACGPNDEILCVDDGSNIKPEFLHDIAKEDERVKPIFLHKNGGQASARNVALKVAHGEWVTFVDSDDEILPSVYEKCFLKVNQSDVVLFGVRVIWNEEHLFKDDIPMCNAMGRLSVSDIESLFRGCLFEYPVNRIYRRAFLKENGISFDSGVCPGEDTIFNLRCLMANARYAFEPSIGYIYYRYFDSSLARYQMGFSKSLRLRNKLWQAVKRHYGIKEEKIKLGELTEQELVYWNVQNDWRYNSPLSLKERWLRLLDNKERLPSLPIVLFLKLIVTKIVRKYFYFSFVRRLRIKKTFPNTKELL